MSVPRCGGCLLVESTSRVKSVSGTSLAKTEPDWLLVEDQTECLVLVVDGEESVAEGAIPPNLAKEDRGPVLELQQAAAPAKTSPGSEAKTGDLPAQLPAHPTQLRGSLLSRQRPAFGPS